MNLHRTIVCLAVVSTILFLSAIVQADEKGIDLSPTTWKVSVHCEKRSGESDLRYRMVFESSDPPAKAGAPRLSWWEEEQEKKRGISFTTANLNSCEWFRTGVGGSQEKGVPEGRMPESTFYFTAGFYDQIKLSGNLWLEGDLEIRYLLAGGSEFTFHNHQAGIFYKTGKLKIGPTLYSRHGTKEDFFAPGVSSKYHFTENIELTVEYFWKDLDWRIGASCTF